MPEPCQSCDFKEIDFGGCRCQAALLTGDPAATDPVCHYSPHRSRIDETLQQAEKAQEKLIYRGYSESGST
jgi:pyrroloquinoline quinone biosynthesis protein E